MRRNYLRRRNKCLQRLITSFIVTDVSKIDVKNQRSEMAFKWQKNDTDNLCVSLFAALYREPDGLTRRELANLIEVSKPTIAKGLGTLIEQELVYKKGKKSTLTGRKPDLYMLNEDKLYWVGVDLRRPNLTIGIYNLSHSLLKHKDIFLTLTDQEDPARLQKHLIQEIENFLEELSIKNNDILGVGIGVPGIVIDGKVISFSYRAEPREYQLEKPVEKELDLPTTVNNDIDSELLAQINRVETDYEENETLIYFAVRPAKGKNKIARIGGSIFHDGSIYQAKRGSSGELGHTSVHTMKEENIKLESHCGNPKCLETYINDKLSDTDKIEVPKEVQAVIKEKIIDLIFTLTPDTIFIDMEGLPSIAEIVVQDLRNFVDSLETKRTHNQIKIKQPTDTTLACSRGAAINSMKDLLTSPEKYTSFPHE